MNFIKVIQQVTTQLDTDHISYALIGGFAMALRGVQRATVDLDFILLLDDLDRADEIFTNNGYTQAFRSENVSHYTSHDLELGRIDILHAFRGPTLGMLERAERLDVAEGLSLPVVQIEDIIGLKVQASVNSPKRENADWSDIRMMLENSSEQGRQIDWDLLSDYLSIFSLDAKLETMKGWYGASK